MKLYLLTPNSSGKIYFTVHVQGKDAAFCITKTGAKEQVCTTLDVLMKHYPTAQEYKSLHTIL